MPESNRVSLCFHPTDNLLLIAISNELYLWQWEETVKDALGRPLPTQPFAVIKTGSEMEKILYCRFSPDGKQLITAISQSEQSMSNVDHDPLVSLVDLTSLGSEFISMVFLLLKFHLMLFSLFFRFFKPLSALRIQREILHLRNRQFLGLMLILCLIFQIQKLTVTNPKFASSQEMSLFLTMNAPLLFKYLIVKI